MSLRDWLKPDRVRQGIPDIDNPARSCFFLDERNSGEYVGDVAIGEKRKK